MAEQGCEATVPPVVFALAAAHATCQWLEVPLESLDSFSTTKDSLTEWLR